MGIQILRGKQIFFGSIRVIIQGLPVGLVIA